ncbi:hypothetical protein EBR78_07335, partial [bacterium]|nr:hypothetical protein [bacterium]
MADFILTTVKQIRMLLLLLVWAVQKEYGLIRVEMWGLGQPILLRSYPLSGGRVSLEIRQR